jgi:hypothetical protein
MSVKRYAVIDGPAEMRQFSDGGYVDFSDYTISETERARLLELVGILEAELKAKEAELDNLYREIAYRGSSVPD